MACRLFGMRSPGLLPWSSKVLTSGLMRWRLLLSSPLPAQRFCTAWTILLMLLQLLPGFIQKAVTNFFTNLEAANQVLLLQ